ncbi:malonyl CoA-acyl carrier protein transacylase [Paraliobacillus quinghaiensis]|uniref:Malonyl CoA-acyl carrier protein transacylase n=1 Tax=Paraliobacillus quinghaiensis TaxID=470815 RepID=A0A917TFK9_9BACI|nr:ACP S-malonyltransferase [Paraliobacillus quinghaiensis]GGM21147.1 malonyl CoA-acyl carrier protein transacylase [Paraliobacillus quinghaiensis]
MKKVAFIYPGQGSQHVGMGEDLYQTHSLVKELFDQANITLDKNITKLMFEGPEEVLTQTENAQPALLLTSAAITRVLLEEGIKPSYLAGHSLGEYSALVAAEAVRIEDALPLVQARGRLMEDAFPSGKGTMAAVLGMEQSVLQAELDKLQVETNEVIEIANLNCPGQIVISGEKTAIERAVVSLKEAGAKRVLPLNVSGPFHSSLMKPAANKLAEKLSEVTFSDAKTPVYANVTAKQVVDKEEIKQLLVKQMYSTVRFEEIIEQMVDSSLDAIVEIGSGKVLTGLVKKVNRRMQTFSIQDSDSLQAFIEWYKEES